MSNLLIEKSAEYLSKTALSEAKVKNFTDPKSNKEDWSTEELSKYNRGDRIHAHSHALTRPDLSGQHISNILARNHPSQYELRDKALLHPNAPEHEIKKALDSYENKGMDRYSEGVAAKLRKHPNAPKGEYPKIDAIITRNKAEKPMPKPTELNIGTKWGDKDIPTSRFD